MKIVADLHLHSKYSRAVSQQMIIPEIARWAKRKGIGLVGTADWTHPLWLRELKENLEEVGEGIYCPKTEPKDILFLLSTEISSIYSQGGKGRRIHNLVFAPSFEVVEKINTALRNRGVKLMSDGRPMTGLSARDLTEIVLEIDKNCLIVPAHCLLPDENLHVQDGIKAIKNIKVREKVYTHKGRWQKVEKVFKRSFSGKVYQIIPDYFRIGVRVTGEHPFWAIKTDSCASFKICRPTCSQARRSCARKYFEDYKPEWVRAEDLQKGDALVYPRFTEVRNQKHLKLNEYITDFKEEGNGLISPGGFRRHKIPETIKIDKKFCRLCGLFLAEGYTTRDLISFCFSENEKNICEQVKKLIKEIFGIKRFREYKRGNYKAIELTFYSKILHRLFSQFFYQNPNERRANNKHLPSWMMKLPVGLQKEIFIGWWQGDRGYTTSRLLMNQMKIICLRLGIIPSIGKDAKEAHEARGKHDRFENRIIKAGYDTFHFSNLSFFEDKFKLLEMPMFKKFKTKLTRRRGWLDAEFVYLPIRKIQKLGYKGEVYNLEVEDDHSYTAEFVCVHNCWTPWYSLYGSNSGFDSIEECYQDLAGNIYAIETGLSSDPAMNWQIKELDNRAILSFSDAHSPPKLGREATLFEIEDLKKLSYGDVRRAIVNKKIVSTIEFYPEEGKYHYTGHRNCQVKQSPEETKKLGATCPVCGKRLTVGVIHRVQQLAGREIDNSKLKIKNNQFGVKTIGYQDRPPYVMLVPLMEILAESLGAGTSSQIVETEYNRLTANLESEFAVLLKVKVEEIAKISGEKVAEGIKKVRAGEIFVDPGFDGVFGTVKIWSPDMETAEGEEEKQMSLF